MNTFASALAAIIIGSTMVASPAVAGSATDALTACLADNTTGRDRKDMARWVFVGMSSHPEMKAISNVTNEDRDALDRTMATMVTRLMADNCQAQAKAAMEKDGSAAFQTAFGVIGRLAMQELMSNPEVNSSFSRFAKYIDQNKMNSSFSKK
jgi:hypothetical protein